MVEQWVIIFATGNLIADIAIALFAIWVHFHSKKKEECYAERERITYQTYEELRFLEGHRKTEMEAYTSHNRSLIDARGRIPSDELEKEWNMAQQRHDEQRQELNNQESKIQWEEGDRISDFQERYFPLFKRYKIYFIVIIGIFLIGVIIQLFALSLVYDFTQVMSKIYASLNDC